MPTYAYRCKSCSHEFEELQRITDDPLKICPSCHKPALVRIIGGGAGLVFKGSGFYLTDYKKSSRGGGESGGGSGSKKKEGGKGDAASTKPDAPSSTGDAGASAAPQPPPKKD